MHFINLQEEREDGEQYIVLKVNICFSTSPCYL